MYHSNTMDAAARYGMLLLAVNLRLFDANTNVTTANSSGNDLSPEVKTFYDKTSFGSPSLCWSTTSSARSGLSPKTAERPSSSASSRLWPKPRPH